MVHLEYTPTRTHAHNMTSSLKVQYKTFLYKNMKIAQGQIYIVYFASTAAK